jgi:hypothetical protein
MASTPEGKIKKKISDYLKRVDGLWYTMPVPGGYGMSTLDYLGCYRGIFFSIEAKAPGNVPTARQEYVMEDIRHAGGTTFVIDDEHFNHFRKWIDDTGRNIHTEGEDHRRHGDDEGAGGAVKA